MSIRDWIDELKFNEIKRPQPEIVIEMLNSDFESEEDVDYDKPILVLSNYYMFLKYQEGLISGRISYLLDELRSGGQIDQDLLKMEKSKIAILRPVIEGIKNKIDVMRKIYDKQIRKSYEFRNIRG